MPTIDRAADIRRYKRRIKALEKDRVYFSMLRLSEAALRVGKEIDELNSRIDLAKQAAE